MSAVVTVSVACYNEERNIRRCLDSLLAQDFDQPFEIILVDGGSTDATRAIIAEYESRYPFIFLYDNPDRVVTGARNIGWRRARTPIIVFTDADCRVPAHWLSRLYYAFLRLKQQVPELAAVGSGNYPPVGEHPFYQIIDIFQNSPFGNRNTLQTKILNMECEVPHIPTLNILYDIKAVERAGGFDLEHFPFAGEDEDLNSRIRRGGGKIYNVPGAEVAHHQRSTLRAWVRNMYAYGYGRTFLMWRNPELLRLFNFIPFALVLAVFLFVPGLILMLAGQSLYWGGLCVPLLFYALFFGVYTVLLARSKGCPDKAAVLFAMFGGTHFFYPMGMIKGLYYILRKRYMRLSEGKPS